MRAPLARWLAEEAARAPATSARTASLDVGCGQKPYEPLFAPYASSYVGVDPVENPRAEVARLRRGPAVAGRSFDLVLCIQVFEHCDDPARAVARAARVTAPGGRVLVSTHGVRRTTRRPRTTGAGRTRASSKLFRDNGEWASVSVTPASGTTACLGMIASLYLDLALRRARARHPRAPARRRHQHRRGGGRRALRAAARARPGTLFANFHVVAQRPA